MDNNDDKRQPWCPDEASAGVASPAEASTRRLQWLRLAHQLSPLVGENGFAALYARSIRLVQPQFIWLTANHSSTPIAQSLEVLVNDFAPIDAAVAARAHTALLNTFTELLSALIGAALTTRLCDSALAGEEQKNAQEQK